MIINKLELVNFRNHKNLSLTFDKSLTIVHGPNGIGKTNVLEAISVFSLGKSPIAIVERDLINIGFSYLRAVGIFTGDEKREFIVSRGVNSSRAKKVFKLNGVIKKTTEFKSGFSSVLFAPSDIKIISGSPSRRRGFLDKLLIQISDDYRKASSLYSRSLKHRNKMLERLFNIPEGLYPSEIEVWDNHLVEAGVLIQKMRTDFFEYVNKKAPYISDDLFTNGLVLNVNYLPSNITKNLLMENFNKDKRRGTTSIGPHLDDFSVFFINNGSKLELKNYGSRGQMRMSVLLLKILSLRYIEDKTGIKPVLLLDDIFSEFDDDYRTAIKKIINNQQTIITTAGLDNVPGEMREIATIIGLQYIIGESLYMLEDNVDIYYKDLWTELK